MGGNKITKISDLKLYQWALSVKPEDYNSLRDNLGDIYDNSAHYYWSSHRTLLLHVVLFASMVSDQHKDTIVIKDNAFYPLNIEGVFEDGEALLLHLFKSSFIMWVGLLPIMSEIYLAYSEKKVPFTQLEFQCVDLWFNILPALGELLDLLNNMNSKYIFMPRSAEVDKLANYTIQFLSPNLEILEEYKDLLPKNRSKEDYIKIGILKHLKYKKEWIELLNAWIETKIEYKFRIKEQKLSAEEAVHLVLREYTLDLSKETLRFLCLNPPVDLDEIRSIASKRRELLKK